MLHLNKSRHFFQALPLQAAVYPHFRLYIQIFSLQNHHTYIPKYNLHINPADTERNPVSIHYAEEPLYLYSTKPLTEITQAHFGQNAYSHFL